MAHRSVTAGTSTNTSSAKLVHIQVDPCGTTNILIGDGGNAGSVSDGYADGAHGGKCPGALATVSARVRSSLHGPGDNRAAAACQADDVPLGVQALCVRSVSISQSGTVVWSEICCWFAQPPGIDPGNNDTLGGGDFVSAVQSSVPLL